MSHSMVETLISPTTRIFRKDGENYKENAYQYATSSYDGMAPSLIIYPESLQEILNIVNFAKKNRLGLAIRTGGHQYSGKKFGCKRILTLMSVGSLSILAF